MAQSQAGGDAQSDAMASMMLPMMMLLMKTQIGKYGDCLGMERNGLISTDYSIYTL